MNDLIEENGNEWEASYNKIQEKYDKFRKKYKNNHRKLKKLKSRRKNSYGSEERAVSKKITKCKKKQNKQKKQVEFLKQKLHDMELKLERQQWDNKYLIQQSKLERRFAELEVRAAVSELLLREALPGLVQKYGKGFKSSGSKSKVIDAPSYTVTEIDD